MDTDFARERRRILLALVVALTAGFLPVIIGTWLAADRAAETYAIPEELGSIWFSLGFGAISCAAIITLAVILINRYHRMLVRAATRDHVTGAYNRQAFESAAEAVKNADLVILCTPVRACGPVAAEIAGRSANVPSGNHLAWLSWNVRGMYQVPSWDPATNSRVESRLTGSTGNHIEVYNRPSTL